MPQERGARQALSSVLLRIVIRIAICNDQTRLWNTLRPITNETAMTLNENKILSDPATSYWLRDAIKAAWNRDLLDAMRDAETLAKLLRERFDAACKSTRCETNEPAIIPLRVNWEGKQPGFYVRRVSRGGLISGHLTEAGGFAGVNRATKFETAQSAVDAARSQGVRCFEILANRIDEPAAPQEDLQSRIYRGELEATDADGVETMGDLQ